MTKILNTLISATRIVFVTDGHPIVVTSSDPKFNEAMTLLKGGKREEALTLLGIPASTSFDDLKGSGFVFVDGQLRLEGTKERVPPVLRDRIQLFLAQGIDCTPLKNFWDKLRKNPDPIAQSCLYTWMEYYGTTIFEDGDILMYKGVKRDYMSIQSGPEGPVHWQIGKEVSMPREKVCKDPSSGCAAGLHVATIDYAKGWNRSIEKLLDIKVNPEHVVSVPKDESFRKIRVCKAWVLGENMRGQWTELTDSKTRVKSISDRRRSVAKLASKDGVVKLHRDSKGNLTLGLEALVMTTFKNGTEVSVMYRSREDRKRKRNLFVGNSKSNETRMFAKNKGAIWENFVVADDLLVIPRKVLDHEVIGMLDEDVGRPYKVRRVRGGLEISLA